MENIKIVIVDDMEQIVKYFSIVISGESDMQIVGTANSGQEAVTVCQREKPDLVLMDIQMETDLAGITAIEKIKKICPETKIVVLTIHEDDDIIFKAYIAGADKFLIKTASVVDIIRAIRSTCSGCDDFHSDLVKKFAGELLRLQNENNNLQRFHQITSKLTAAELDILKLVYAGYTYKQIAKLRYVEEVTVRTQANKILKKTGAKSIKSVIKELKKMNAFRTDD